MRGLDWDNPYRIRTWQELINWVNEVGFLPLFANSVSGFSAEEHVSPLFWWTGDPEQDPWEWREIIAKSHQVAYGKFFGNKAGFISVDWLPYFANYRRDGYDFDARWEDGLVGRREKSIMDLLTGRDDDGDMTFPDTWLLSTELKKKAGFGKEGSKNFPGIITSLQMQTYLVIADFHRRQKCRFLCCSLRRQSGAMRRSRRDMMRSLPNRGTRLWSGCGPVSLGMTRRRL